MFFTHPDFPNLSSEGKSGDARYELAEMMAETFKAWFLLTYGYPISAWESEDERTQRLVMECEKNIKSRMEFTSWWDVLRPDEKANIALHGDGSFRRPS